MHVVRRKSVVRWLSVSLALIANVADGQSLDRRLIGTFPADGGPITISTTDRPVLTSGLRFITRGGTITLGESSFPYDESRQTDNVTKFGFNRVVLDGSLSLDAIASSDAVIEASWFQPFASGGSRAIRFPFLGGDAARFGIMGSYAYDGGPITIEPVLPEFPVKVRKLDFAATVGLISSSGNAAPFSSLVANDGNRWTASSQIDVLIDGTVTLDANYTPTLLADGLTGQVSDALGSEQFEITRREPELSTQITGSYSKQGPIVVESTSGPVVLRGLDFFSDGQFAQILGGTIASPFETVTVNRNDRWSVRSERDVVLDGKLQLDATVAQNTRVTGHTWDGSVSQKFELGRRHDISVDVRFPYDGGPISISGRSESSVSSLDIRLTDGQLVGGNNPTPFQTINNNLPDRWFAESESMVALPSIFGSPINLDVAASSDAVGTAIVSNGPDFTTIDLTRSEPLWHKSLIGGYSMTDGGPVSLASNRPVSLRTLRIEAMPEYGRLIGGLSASPFESVTTNSETTWAVESKGEVIIDGLVQLDLEVEPKAFLSGQTFDGKTTTSINFNGVGVRDASEGRSTGGWFFGAYSEEGGPLMLLAPNGPYQAGGISFNAEPGILTAGEDPSPFAFFVPNSAAPGDVTLGILGTRTTIEGVVPLDVSVAPNTPEGSFSAFSASPRTNVSLSTISIPVTMIPSLEKFAAPTNTCIVPDDELVGDLDGDGTVQFSDFLTLAGNFGLEVDTYGEGDINCNGTVDFEDFIRLGGNFGTSRPAASAPIPEPATVSLLLIGLFAMVQFRPRRA